MSAAFNFDEKWEELRTGFQLIIDISTNVVTDKKIWVFISCFWSTAPSILGALSLKKYKKKSCTRKLPTFLHLLSPLKNRCKSLQKFLLISSNPQDPFFSLQHIAPHHDEILLREYLKSFENFTSATSKIRNIFAYMVGGNFILFFLQHSNSLSFFSLYSASILDSSSTNKRWNESTRHFWGEYPFTMSH